MNKTPAVRFKGFTEDWEQRKLCEITTEKLTNGVMNYRSVEPTDVRHINVINMYTSDEIHIDELSFSAYDDSVINKCNVEFGDVFLTRSSLKPEGIAEPNVLLANGRFVFDDHLIRMKINKKKYDPCFIKICLETRHIKEQFIKSSKTTAFTTIGQDDIAECIGFFPDITEQKSLALIFSSIDNLITLHQHKYEKLKNIKKSMLYKMFPQNGRKVPEIRFTGFTDDWEQRKLLELGEIVTGSTPSTAKAEYYSENGLPWVTPTDIKSNIISNSPRKLSDEGVRVARVVPANTILCTCIASIGKNALLTVKGSFNQQINSLKPNEENDPYFLLTESEIWSNHMKQMAASGTMQIINKTEFSELPTMIPKYEEQKIIGEYFKYIDNLITLHQRKLEKLKQLKQAMLHKMFV